VRGEAGHGTAGEQRDEDGLVDGAGQEGPRPEKDEDEEA